ncbi:gamma-glutamylcyclotransferase family protein [Halalkalibacter kiskunsagensis]|uniref:Gamma-glutamylcyclotransferase family protein n=1 Tax=Halalkalibacter kiskunsagensis TaxID=1548599 RepID=A0ABV6KHN4_9BACI
MNRRLLFVYGTLRKRGSNHHFIETSKLIEGSCFVFGELHDTGLGYPVLQQAGENMKVIGELYEVTDRELQQVDQLEGYSPSNQTNEYIRIINQVCSGNKYYEAYVYIAGDQLQYCHNLIKDGDWISYCKDKP